MRCLTSPFRGGGALDLTCFHLLKNICYFPLLVLKGIYHYWKYLFSQGLKQMEACVWTFHRIRASLLATAWGFLNKCFLDVAKRVGAGCGCVWSLVRPLHKLKSIMSNIRTVFFCRSFDQPFFQDHGPTRARVAPFGRVAKALGRWQTFGLPIQEPGVGRRFLQG